MIESLKDLKQSFAGLPVERQRVRTSSYVIGFEVDSSALLVEHTEALSPFIATLRDYPASAVVSVVGRASQTGPEASNRQLARDRADRVRAYLIASGVPEDRVGPVVGNGGVFSMPDPPGPVDFDWFDGRFIVLASIGASAIVGGVDVAALRFYNADGPWPEASFADYPIGVTLGVGGVAMIGYFNVDL